MYGVVYAVINLRLRKGWVVANADQIVLRVQTRWISERNRAELRPQLLAILVALDE